MLVSSLVSAHQSVSRCAVCKIDRKGRFVYADNEAEQLFGLSQIELFGKPFLEFVAPENHSQIVMITTQSSRYETFYDSTWVKLIDAQGKESLALIVISLNFDSGNPVNYQLIIHLPEEKDTLNKSVKNDSNAKQFLEHVASLYDLSKSVETANNLCQFSKMRGVGIYDADRNPPILLHAACSVDFNNQAERDKVIELLEADFDLDINQKYEYCATVGNGDTYLLRYLLHTNQSDEENGLSIELASTATRLLDRLLGLSQSDRNLASAHIASYPLMEILQNMTLGGAMTGIDGMLVDYNESFKELLDIDPEGMDIAGLTNYLANTNSSKEISLIKNFFKTAVKSENSSPLSVRIRLTGERYADLSFFFLLPGTGDMTGYFAINPVERYLSSGGYSSPSESFLSSALDSIKGGIAATETLTDSLAEGDSQKDPGKFEFTIDSINNQLSTTEELTSDLIKNISSICATEKPRQSDPIALIAKVVDTTLGNKYSVSYTISDSAIETVELCSNRFSEIISLVCEEIGNIYNKPIKQDRDPVNISVKLIDANLTIIFESSVIHNLTEMKNVAKQNVMQSSDNFVLLKEFCKSLGGEISIGKSFQAKRTDKEDMIEIKIPV